MCDDGVLKGSYRLSSCPDATKNGIDYRHKNTYPKNDQTPNGTDSSGRRSPGSIKLVP